MAEALGIAASIIQIADVGVRLSLKIIKFGCKIKDAKRKLKTAANDVSFTCNVLRQLSDCLSNENLSRFYNQNAVDTVQAVVKECEKIFAELEGLLENKEPGTDSEQNSVRVRLQRGAWKAKSVFLEERIEFLRSNLDRLKSTLLLMLQVMEYAGQRTRKAHAVSLDEQQNIVLELNKEKEENEKRYKNLMAAIQGIKPSGDDTMATISRANPGFTTPEQNSFHPMLTVMQKEELDHYRALVDSLLRG